MSRRRLEFKPEPVEVMRARYPEAIKELIDTESVALGLRFDPGASREHVFDLEEGARLIISREDQGEEGEVIHLSASVNLERDLPFPIFATLEEVQEFAEFCERKFYEISGDRRKLVKYMVTESLILHWFIMDPARQRR